MHVSNRKQFWLNTLTLIPVLIIAALIFHFSAQPATQSAATSGRALYTILQWLKLDFDSLSAVAQSELVESFQHMIRKIAHFLEYGAFGFFLMLHVKVRGASRPWLWTVGLGVAYAISDEVHQMFVPGRSGQVSDVWLDGVGVLFGVSVLLLVWKVYVIMLSSCYKKE